MGNFFVFNVLVMLAFGRFMPKTEVMAEDTTEAIDTTPWKYAMLIGAVISILVISTYFIFS